MSTPQTPQPESPAAPAAPAAPFEYAAAQAAAAPKKGGKGKKVLAAVGTIALIVAVKVGVGSLFSDDPVRAKVGDCAVVAGTDKDPDFKVVGCDDAKANTKVSKVIDNSFDVNACGDDFVAIAQQKGTEKFVLCLTPTEK
ncbi:hypothetical protein Kpho02_08760 [Kitasatospora phosalacinea]|uniref:Uncharacterized protein n=1 Tax=Kitasatospora phosalacinea TaxID=2065 RepID=A0A9W6Q5J8_9ACTN|nr:hypothetical protein [Kitasatospora phosalacinea]GLW68577.1 hypothetical protein Kpho02_08760 [Kitasatospora phosalacinea]